MTNCILVVQQRTIGHCHDTGRRIDRKSPARVVVQRVTHRIRGVIVFCKRGDPDDRPVRCVLSDTVHRAIQIRDRRHGIFVDVRQVDRYRSLVKQSAPVGDSHGQHKRRRNFIIQRRRIQNRDLPGRRVYIERTVRVARDNAVTGRVTRIRITGGDDSDRRAERGILRQRIGRRIHHRRVVGSCKDDCRRLRPVRRHPVADRHVVRWSRFVPVVYELHKTVVHLRLSEAGDRHARVCQELEPAAGNTADRIRQLRCRLFEVRGTQIGRSQHNGVAFGNRERVIDDRRRVVRCQNLNVRGADVAAEDAVFHGHGQNTIRIVGVLRCVVVGDCSQHLLIHGFAADTGDGQYTVRVTH